MGTELHKELISAPGVLRMEGYSSSQGPAPTAAKTETSKAKSVGFKAKSVSYKKKLIRRKDRDYSQALRRGYQFAFLLMNVWLGGQFYLWVRHYETAGASAYVSRPAGVEGWLPIAGMMNLKYFLVTRQVPELHPAAMFLLLTFLAMAFLFRKAFCSWLCPVGTLSECLWKLGRKLFRRNFTIPRWVDMALRGLKYVLLGFFVWAVSRMSAKAIASFMRSPYGVVADVKMLNFFRFIGETGLIVLGVLVVASALVQNFWCRYLCPYGALLGLASLFSPMRIRRNVERCIDCAKCAKTCPATLPVDKLVTIKSAECTGCLECLAVCPAEGALGIGTKDGRMPAWAFAAGVAVLFVGMVGFAKGDPIYRRPCTSNWFLTLMRPVIQCREMPRCRNRNRTNASSRNKRRVPFLLRTV